MIFRRLTRCHASSARDHSWRSLEVPLVPYAGWVFLSRNISRLLYWLQLASAAACVVLSVTRLAQQDYGELKLHQAENRNRRPALNVFYGLALAEALLFLAERAFWEWKLSRCRLLEQVSRECGLGPSGVVSIRRFFYDAYSRCVNGSIFDGIRMDLVSFAEELLGSGSRDEQLIGASILLRFATSRRFKEATLRKVGTSAAAMERLVEMLDWKSPAEVEIRRAAAVLVSKLAGKKQNVLRVAGIAGAMESISSLLYTGRAANGTRPEEVTHRYLIADRADYEYSTFNLLGLRILKKLSNDHHNCGKIGKTRGLLPKIVDFTGEIGHKLRRRKSGGAGSEFEIQEAKTALQALKMLAGTTGRTGELLRREISEIVFTVSNIREILRHGEEEKALEMLAVEILTCLAMDGEVRERIGATGGVVRELLRIFFSGGGRQSLEAARVEAGEALAMLAVESEGNCRRIVGDGEDVVGRLVVAVEDGVVGLNACRILRNICAYGLDSGHLRQGLRGVIQAFPTVFKAVSCEEMKKLEGSIGLAAQVVRLMSHSEFAEELERAGISGTELIQRMVLILQRYNNPSTMVPRIRRFVIELSIWIMQSDEKFIKLFDDFGMMRELSNVVDTTSDLECFIVFSGSVGLSRHRTSMSSLVDTALQFIKRAESTH
ncbi:hypothetical protein AXF42_Ash012389 [Apostasia shenzhenica]|uniref:Uncharacterized protein n=1 Tax=Apostasia shenzhenica TaxID=1088818 RepID=A0A2I0AD20_9ASPA|nr:hypothetical protein AXF42_Ash012389 [Apostasia shenzhenica]